MHRKKMSKWDLEWDGNQSFMSLNDSTQLTFTMGTDCIYKRRQYDLLQLRKLCKHHTTNGKTQDHDIWLTISSKSRPMIDINLYAVDRMTFCRVQNNLEIHFNGKSHPLHKSKQKTSNACINIYGDQYMHGFFDFVHYLFIYQPINIPITVRMLSSLNSCKKVRNMRLRWNAKADTDFECDWLYLFDELPLIRVVISGKLVTGYIRSIDAKRHVHVPVELIQLCLHFIQQIGTKHMVFKPATESESKHGTRETCYYQHLSALPELKNASSEELRYEDLYNNSTSVSASSELIFNYEEHRLSHCLDTINTLRSANHQFRDAINNQINEYQNQLQQKETQLQEKETQLKIMNKRYRILKKKYIAQEKIMDEYICKHHTDTSTNTDSSDQESLVHQSDPVINGSITEHHASN
eukprot:954937_1